MNVFLKVDNLNDYILTVTIKIDLLKNIVIDVGNRRIIIDQEKERTYSRSKRPTDGFCCSAKHSKLTKESID